MKKYFKYIIIIIASLFVIIGMNVMADDSICSKTKSTVLTGKKTTICSWTYNENSNGSSTYYKVSLYFQSGKGLWGLDFSDSQISVSGVKSDSLESLFSDYNNGDYKYSSKSFNCPKGIKTMKFKNKTLGGVKIDKINFTTSTTGSSKINIDYPNDINEYATKKIDELNKYECSDSKLKKVKADITDECDFSTACAGTIGQRTKCTAAMAPIITMIEEPQKKLQSAYKNKSKSCDCDSYTDATDKKNCEKNVDKLEDKAKKIEKNTETAISTAEEAAENYNYKKVVIDEEEATCEGILSKEGTEFLQKILKFVQYGGVIVALLSSTLDFIKSVSSGSQDDLKKASTRFLKRMIFAALLFFVVILTNILLGIFNITVPSDCV